MLFISNILSLLALLLKLINTAIEEFYFASMDPRYFF